MGVWLASARQQTVQVALPESYPSKGADWGTYTLLSGVPLSEVAPCSAAPHPTPSASQ